MIKEKMMNGKIIYRKGIPEIIKQNKMFGFK